MPCAMCDLQALDMSGLSTAGPLPSAWSSLTSLTALDLSSTGATGALPAAWSTLSLLKTVDLSSNSLTGSVPSSWQTGMTSVLLVVLSGNNGVCGVLPNPWTLGGTPVTATAGTTLINTACPNATLQAQQLIVIAGQLGNPTGLSSWTGDNPCGPPTWAFIACFGGLVTGLDLTTLTGVLGQQIPSGLSALTGLSTLKLGGLSLTGAAPDNLSALTALTQLDLQDNALTGTLPSAWSTLTKLKVRL